jgi:putative phosphoribosyl transferase
VFRDRIDAGARLGERLARLADRNPIVLGLARGGMVVAAEVAARLKAELDVLVARKVGHPLHPEYGIGAVGPDGARFFDERAVGIASMTAADLEGLADAETAEVQRRLETYRRGRGPLRLKGRDVIIVDDGLATGVTAVAAVKYVRSQEPGRITLAIPVASRQGIELLSRFADDVVCLFDPPMFSSVGQWYEDFSQTPDDEVMGILRAHCPHRGGYAA